MRVPRSGAGRRRRCRARATSPMTSSAGETTASPRDGTAEVGQQRAQRAAPGSVPALQHRARRVGAEPVGDQLVGDRVGVRHAHVDHQRPALAREPRPVLLGQAPALARDEADGRGMVAVGQRHQRGGRRTERRGHAGDHLDRTPAGRQRRRPPRRRGRRRTGRRPSAGRRRGRRAPRRPAARRSRPAAGYGGHGACNVDATRAGGASRARRDRSARRGRRRRPRRARARRAGSAGRARRAGADEDDTTDGGRRMTGGRWVVRARWKARLSCATTKAGFAADGCAGHPLSAILPTLAARRCRRTMPMTLTVDGR